MRRSTKRALTERGFSLIEMMIVVAISLIVTVVSVLSMMPMLQQGHVNNAYNYVLAAMRQARDNAVSQQTAYSVTFSNASVPNTIVVAPTLTFTADVRSFTYSLPTDVTFLVQGAVATTSAPDSGAGANFGTAANAIDFGYTSNGNAGGTTQTVVYFCPDGSAQTTSACVGAGNWDDGVVYISRSGNLMSSRAISLWGGTGRIRGWRFYNAGGSTYQWTRQ